MPAIPESSVVKFALDGFEATDELRAGQAVTEVYRVAERYDRVWSLTEIPAIGTLYPGSNPADGIKLLRRSARPWEPGENEFEFSSVRLEYGVEQGGGFAGGPETSDGSLATALWGEINIVTREVTTYTDMNGLQVGAQGEGTTYEEFAIQLAVRHRMAASVYWQRVGTHAGNGWLSRVKSVNADTFSNMQVPPLSAFYRGWQSSWDPESNLWTVAHEFEIRPPLTGSLAAESPFDYIWFKLDPANGAIVGDPQANAFYPSKTWASTFY